MTGQTKNFRSKKHDGSANPIDIYVGRRIHDLRTSKGWSQTQLASLLGITFQQIQKYEKGLNRISASRLLVYGTADGRIGRLLFQRNQRRTMERKFQTAAAVMEKTRFNRVIFMYEWLS